MVTLEISGADIRIIAFNGRRITGWASATIDPGWYEEGVVSNPLAMASAIRQIMSSSVIKDKNIFASINSLYSLSRILTVSIPGEQPLTQQAVLQAAEVLMPLSMDDMYFSWQQIARNDDGYLVSVFGVPRDVLDSELRALRAAGITPKIMDLKTLALARAARRDNAILLNIDVASFDIVIIAGGVAEVLRTTVWQPNTFTVEEQSEQLISALELTVSFYDTHHPSSNLNSSTPLFVTGHLSGNQSLIQFLENGQNHPLEQLSPPFEYPEHFPVSQYAVGIGLAMKEMTASRFNLNFSSGNKKAARPVKQTGSSIPDVNLLPQTYKPWRPSPKQISYTLAMITALGLILPLYNMATKAMNDTATVRQRYNAVNLTMEKRKAELSKREPIQKAIAQYDVLVAMGGGFVDDITAVWELAGELKVKTDVINHAGNSVTFICEAPDYIVFRDFIAGLENNGRFTTPIIPPEGYPYIKGGTVKLTPKR